MMTAPIKSVDILHAAQIGDLITLKLAFTTSSCSPSAVSHGKSGDTIAHIAARFGHVIILKHFRSELDFEAGNFDGKRPLHEAAQAEQSDVVRFLIQEGVHVDALKRADWTPLMLACTKPCCSVVRDLVTAGALLHLRNKDGWTAFHIACREGHTEILEYLLSCESSLWDTVSKNGRTPLHTSAMHGHMAAIELLLTRGEFSTVDIRDSCGTTPLMDSLRTGHTQVAALLIKGGADVHAADDLGHQCLHLAAQTGKTTSLRHLLDNCGININAKATSGASALHVAAKDGQHAVISFLLAQGADPSQCDSHGRTALDIARGCRKPECVQLLATVTNPS